MKKSDFSFGASLAFVVFFFCAHAQAVEIGDPVKNKKGQVKRMGPYWAERYCRKKGGRLPTPREYAELATRSGAKIRETQLPTKGLITNELAAMFNSSEYADQDEVQAEIKRNHAEHYEPVFIQRNGVNAVDFYINTDDYKPQDPEKQRFWTSSGDWDPRGLTSEESNSGQESGYLVFGGKKAIYSIANGLYFWALPVIPSTASVRCVIDAKSPSAAASKAVGSSGLGPQAGVKKVSASGSQVLKPNDPIATGGASAGTQQVPTQVGQATTQ